MYPIITQSGMIKSAILKLFKRASCGVKGVKKLCFLQGQEEIY